MNGSGRVRNLSLARGLFDEILTKGLQPSCFAYTSQGFMWRADSWCYFIDFSVEGDDVERNLF
jgi:pentatricopeptide repeat protein